MIPNREPDIARFFQLTSLDGNNNKYWNLRAWRENGALTVEYHWGRVGDTGQRTVKQETERSLESKIRSKQRISSSRPIPYNEIIKSNQVFTDYGQGPVADFVRIMFEAANESIGGWLAGDVSGMSLAQIYKARGILDKLGEESNGNPLDAKSLIQEYYNTIPTVLPRKIDPFKVVIDFMKKENLQRTEDNLNQLEAAIQVQDTEAIDLDAVVGNRIRVCQKSDLPIQMFEQTARGNPRIVEVFEIDTHEQFSPVEGYEPMLLWHGSGFQNWRHIVRSGLRMPNTNSWGNFGPGIYFADEARKSQGYTGTYKDLRALLLNEVAVGKPYVVARGSNDRLRKPPDGHHSVLGNLGHNEYIVYTKPQQRLKYVILYR